MKSRKHRTRVHLLLMIFDFSHLPLIPSSSQAPQTSFFFYLFFPHPKLLRNTPFQPIPSTLYKAQKESPLSLVTDHPAHKNSSFPSRTPNQMQHSSLFSHKNNNPHCESIAELSILIYKQFTTAGSRAYEDQRTSMCERQWLRFISKLSEKGRIHRSRGRPISQDHT